MKKLIVPLALAVSAVAAHGEFLYYEDFNGGSGTLAGAAPYLAPGAEVWSIGDTTETRINGNGDILNVNSIAYLPISLEINTTYTLATSFNLSANTSDTSWLAQGFSTQTGTLSANRLASIGTGGVDWFLVRRNGNTSAFGGEATANQWVGTTSSPISVGNNMQLITTLTTGATLADSTISMQVVDANTDLYTLDLDDTGPETSRSIDASGIKYLAISASTLNGSFNSLTFSSSVPEPTTFARTYFVQGWEDLTVPNDNEWSIEAENPTYTVVETSDSIVHSGSRALKIELSNPDGIYKRSEFVKKGGAVMGEQYFYRFSMYLPPADYPHENPGGGHTIIAQWHGKPDFELGETWREPTLAFSIKENGKLGIMSAVSAQQVNDDSTLTKINHRNADGSDFDIPKGQWVTFEVSVRWHYTSSGYLDIWMDGEHIVSYDGPTSYNDAIGPYFKIGIYRPASYTEHETIYFDNLQILKNGLIVYPDRDTSVRGGNHSDTNYGNDDTLTIRSQMSNLQNDYQAYLHFDYNKFGDYIFSAGKLFLQPNYSQASAPLHVYRTSGDWVETSLTYNSAASLSVFGFQGDGDTSLESFEVPIPDFDLDGNMALRLSMDVDGSMIQTGSRESSLITARPMLFLDL